MKKRTRRVQEHEEEGGKKEDEEENRWFNLVKSEEVRSSLCRIALTRAIAWQITKREPPARTAPV